MTRHAAATVARQAETGLSGHKSVESMGFIEAVSTPPAKATTEPAPKPVWDWAAANERKKAAIQQLAPLADSLDDIEALINELLARTNDLEMR